MFGSSQGIARYVGTQALAVVSVLAIYVAPAPAGLKYRASIELEDDVLCVDCVTKVTVSVASSPICQDQDGAEVNCHAPGAYPLPTCPPAIDSFVASLRIEGGACFVTSDAACGEATCVETGTCVHGTVECPPPQYDCSYCNQDNLCHANCQGFNISPGGSKTFWIKGTTPGQYTLEVRGYRECEDPPPGAIIEYFHEFEDEVEFTVAKVEIVTNLLELQKIDPGWYMAVNWDDDDGDGWTNKGDPPEAVYTPDKDDDEIVTPTVGGDDDLVHNFFIINVTPDDLSEGGVKLTFPAKIKAWVTPTKKTSGGASSEVPSGMTIGVEYLPVPLFMEGVQGSDTFRDVELKAEFVLGGQALCEDILKVTVFEVDLTAYYTGFQQFDNERRFSDAALMAGLDRRGKISWDDANGDGVTDDPDIFCQYFHNNMELQGTLKPAFVPGQSYPAEFDFKRYRWVKMWEMHAVGGEWREGPFFDASWTDDDKEEADEDLTPSPENHIYVIDGPGWRFNTRPPDRVAYIGNFRDMVLIKLHGNWYQASDWYKWHAQLYTEPKISEDPEHDDKTTRSDPTLQKLGDGWITIPNNP